MSISQFDAVGLGTATVDYVGLVAPFPEPDEKQPMLEFLRDGGGLVGTARDGTCRASSASPRPSPLSNAAASAAAARSRRLPRRSHSFEEAEEDA